METQSSATSETLTPRHATGSVTGIKSGFWTVSRKLTLLIVTLTALGFSVFLFFSGNSLKANLQDLALHNYTEMSKMLAEHASGGVQWRKEKKVEETFNKATKEPNSPLSAMAVYNDPTVKKPFSATFVNGELNDELAKQSLDSAPSELSENPTVVTTQESLVVTVPIVSSKSSAKRLGTLITVWDTTRIDAVVMAELNELIITSLVTLLVLASVIGIAINRGVGRRIRHSSKIAKQIAAGNLSNKIKPRRNDEISQLIYALNEIQISLLENDDTEKKAAEFGRIKRALDSAPASTMLLDSDQNIVYVNQSAIRLLQDTHELFDLGISGEITARDLIGKNSTVFSKYSELYGASIDNLDSDYTFELNEASHTLKVTLSPVLDSDGHRLGTVIIWFDRSLEVTAQRQVQEMVDAAANGDFSRRIDTANMKGFYLQVAELLNKMVEKTDCGLKDTQAILQAMAEGDLDKKLDSSANGVFADLRDSCNATTNKLKSIVSEVRKTASEVNQGAYSISQGNLDLSDRTQKQASNLEQTTAEMNEIMTVVEKSAERARQASDLTAVVSREAEQGGKIAERAVNAVEEISEASNEIASIVTVIDSIAFQTNLLALNAAVEAARAGEQGRGFAVVATEVRNLAGRSATAAREIKNLIDNSVEKVEEGKKLVGQSGETLTAIVDSVKQASSLVSEIATASSTQTESISQINSAVTQIDEVTRNNVDLVEEATLTINSVSKKAVQLEDLMSFFGEEEIEMFEELELQDEQQEPGDFEEFDEKAA